jgi:peptidoglycan/LPS O-acetylase OafA/YrhL
VHGFYGGFVGVDIFFVISGFLMTCIIFSKVNKNQFLISEFYMARGRPIIPALCALCLALLFVGWFILTLNDYAQLGKHITGCVAFLSNVFYWR